MLYMVINAIEKLWIEQKMRYTCMPTLQQVTFWNHAFLSVNFQKSSINNFYVYTHIIERWALIMNGQLLNNLR